MNHKVVEPDKDRSGYDCHFVEPPHHQLQTKCSVCLCILKDPFMVDCCGYSFCHTCIKTVQDFEKPCPLCNKQFMSYPDKRLHRILKGMKVYCANAEAGCDWQGELAALSEHLNMNPSIDRKPIGCIYTEVACDYCGVLIERRYLSHHHLEDCQQRPYSCDYCYDYQSTCESVIVDHWPVCPARPMSCPNECGVYPERNNLQKHLREECQMAVIKCHYCGVGCEFMVERKNMDTHLEIGVRTHLSLQSQYYGNQFDRLERKINDCESKISELEKENASLKSQLRQVADKNLSADVTNRLLPIDGASSCVQAQGRETSVEELEQLKSLVCVPPLQFTIHSVLNLQTEKKKWLSAPFYSYCQGYQMCLKVYCGGHSTSEGSDLSVYVCMMKGHYDDVLKWPFRGYITLQLVDQLKHKDHVVHTITFHEDVCWEISGRVADDVMSGGWGILKFVSLNKLVPNYVKNGSIQIKIEKVAIA